MLRVMDKFCRIKTFIESGTLAVKGEPVDDAILDIINYMVLLAGMIEEKREAKLDRRTQRVLDDVAGMRDEWPQDLDETTRGMVPRCTTHDVLCNRCGNVFPETDIHMCGDIEFAKESP